MTETAEQAARDMLERMGIENAQSFTAGDVVELANLIAASKKATPAQEWEPLTPERLEKLNQSRSEEPATYWVAAKGQHQGEKPYLGTYSYFDQVFYCDDERAIHASNVTHIMAVYIPELPKT